MKALSLPPQITNVWQKVWPGVSRHHYFIFLLLLLGGLVAAIYMVSQTLNLPSDTAYFDQRRNNSLDINFNQDIIKRIEALQRPNDGGSTPVPVNPGVRTNPFAE